MSMTTGKKIVSVLRGRSSFLLTAAVLVLAAVGLRPGLEAAARHYEKTPIDIRQPLEKFDISRLPTFSNGWTYSFAGAEPQEIGTDHYIHVLLDRKTRGPGPDHVEFFVTYYTDPRSKVPHTPEVCSRQAGATVQEISTVLIDTGQPEPDNRRIRARLLRYQNPRSEGRFGQPVNVVDMYVFYVEGRFCYTRGQARWVIAMPGNRHTFFSKIEAAASMRDVVDRAEALETLETLMREAIPILLAEHFPRPEDVRRR
jgi:hypothetical protein